MFVCGRFDPPLPTSINFESMPSTIVAIFVSAVSVAGTIHERNKRMPSKKKRICFVFRIPFVKSVRVSLIIGGGGSGAIVDESPLDNV